MDNWGVLTGSDVFVLR